MTAKFPQVDIRKDIYGNWQLQSVTESVTVPSGSPYTVRLREIPDNGEIESPPTIDGLSRANTYYPGDGQFAVKYSIGTLIFNSAQAGNTYTVEYYGKGSLVDAVDINYLYNRVTEGTTDGELAYWDGINNTWTPIDSDSLYWNAAEQRLETNQIWFSTTFSPSAHETGTVHWNSQEETLEVDTPGETRLQVGQEIYVKIKNASERELVSGDIVYPIGATGDNPKADLAKADALTTSRPIAIVTQPIGINNIGIATIFGKVRGIDTTAWEEGDLLYVSGDTAGLAINTKPNYPYFAMRIGVVIRKHANEGIIIIDSDAESDIYTHGSVMVTNGNGEIGEDPDYINWDFDTKTLYTSGINADTATIGSSANYTEFEEDGTIVSYGDATTWRDELHELTGENLESPSSQITLNASEGSITFSNSSDTTEFVIMNVQINHDWKMGTDIYPHLHYWQTSSNVANWLIEYRWQSNDQPKTTTWTRLAWDSTFFTYSSGTLNQIVSFGNISPPAGYGLSDIVQLKLIRDTNNDSGLFNGTDPEASAVDALSFDVHIQCDTLGSRQEYVK